jgi:hypothetical protein
MSSAYSLSEYLRGADEQKKLVDECYQEFHSLFVMTQPVRTQFLYLRGPEALKKVSVESEINGSRFRARMILAERFIGLAG